MGDDLGKNIGLSEAEAALRLKAEGYNELPSSKKRSILAIAKEMVSEPVFLLLVGGGAIYLILGDLQEALIQAYGCSPVSAQCYRRVVILSFLKEPMTWGNLHPRNLYHPSVSLRSRRNDNFSGRTLIRWHLASLWAAIILGNRQLEDVD